MSSLPDLPDHAARLRAAVLRVAPTLGAVGRPPKAATIPDGELLALRRVGEGDRALAARLRLERGIAVSPSWIRRRREALVRESARSRAS